jgi:signal transduction histidine kinase
VHPEDLDRCLATYNSAFDARQSFQMEYRLKTADGTYRWILDHGTSYYREGKFAGYIGSCLDVTERKHWTEQMRASAARLMEAQRLANVGNWERDFVTDEVWCSEEAINMLGLKEEGIFRFEDLFSRIDPRDQDRIVECEAKILASNLPVEIEYRIVRPDREIRFLRSIAQGIRNDQGDLVRIVGATQDITETVKAEEEMQRVRGALAAARDEESRRIARDLHDDISQRLALLSVDLAAASATPDLSEERARTMLTLFRDSVLEISESVRRISHELHPSIVDTLGLSAALEALCHDSFDREKVTVQFQSGVLPDDLHADIATCLYRVTQEALHNVSKHAKAREVSVSIDVVGSSIQLKIDDSGIGFDASSTTDGLGLQSMRERVALVNGSFSVESKIGAGTRIDIEVPLSIAAHAQSAG